jgi:hypothetical protein
MGAGGWKRNHLFEIALWKVRAFPHYFIWPKPGKPVHPSRSGSIISGAVQIKNTIDLTEPCYIRKTLRSNSLIGVCSKFPISNFSDYCV